MTTTTLKSPAEIEIMDQANRIIREILTDLRESVRPGMSTLDIDLLAEERILKAGGVPAFKGYPHRGDGHDFPGTVCASVNDEVVHGIPSRDGRIADEAAFEALAQRLPSATDCFVFCHGWLYDRGEARTEAARFFSQLDQALTPLRDSVSPLRVALHWPSKPFAGESDRARAHEIELFMGARGSDTGGAPRLTESALTRSRRGRPPRANAAAPRRPIDATPAGPSHAVPPEESDASSSRSSIPGDPVWPDLLGGLDPASIPATRLRALHHHPRYRQGLLIR